MNKEEIDWEELRKKVDEDIADEVKEAEKNGRL